jgi:acyl transferase domain-containing protein
MRRAYETAGVALMHRVRGGARRRHAGAGPAEAEALRSVLARGREAPLLVGSVKANIGHAQGAAGAASLIKAALALRHREVPPQPGGSAPSGALGCELELSRTLRPLPPSAPAFAGVSAMGLGGASGHVVLATARRRRCGRRVKTGMLTARASRWSCVRKHALGWRPPSRG